MTNRLSESKYLQRLAASGPCCCSQHDRNLMLEGAAVSSTYFQDDERLTCDTPSFDWTRPSRGTACRSRIGKNRSDSRPPDGPKSWVHQVVWVTGQAATASPAIGTSQGVSTPASMMPISVQICSRPCVPILGPTCVLPSCMYTGQALSACVLSTVSNIAIDHQISRDISHIREPGH